MLHGVFQKAYLEEVIKYNPVHNTEWHLEKTEKRKREALDKNQERILIELLRYNVNRFDRGSCINLIELILHTGLRKYKYTVFIRKKQIFPSHFCKRQVFKSKIFN